MYFQGSCYGRMSSVVCGRNLQIELMIVLFPVGDICYVHFKKVMDRMVSTIGLTSFDALSSTTRKLSMESATGRYLKRLCADQRMIRDFPIRTRATLI